MVVGIYLPELGARLTQYCLFVEIRIPARRSRTAVAELRVGLLQNGNVVGGCITRPVGHQRVLFVEQPASLVGEGDDRVLLHQLMAPLLWSLVHKRDHRVLLYELLPLIEQRARCGALSPAHIHGNAIPVHQCVVETVSCRPACLHVGHN